ncbi:ABC transporter substrate-binding protein [Noviherbaspirillum saxi]|uniref:Extracellular solute-binding protein n=1 Tax=Noviherbaspirillum saxi TaxID=2320863 RepID=A0A3A3FG24_9BURK|nr:extracellular solute-binding protein [Noviherbaspirillum saxi]RJF92326.1 extracellular solute-binding protein [Noviherbaspirillum saxi]
MRKILVRTCISALMMFAATAAHSASVSIVTSFPKELTDVYKKAFEEAYPDTTVEFIGKSTGSAVGFVKNIPVGQRPDVFWASAPDVFELMARDHLLEKAPEVRNPAVPPKIGQYPMNDPDGLYYGQALSGYGIMWNKPYLQKNGLPKPAEWEDLTKAAYFGHVAMSSPSRSGTTHLTVETILQGEGWDYGWSQLLKIAGNCATITDRSFDVPDGVNKGKFGVGLVIDFFALSGKFSGNPVDFAYPTKTAVVPASIALVAGAKNPAAGKRFIAFALSRKGQELLLEPKISRIPVLPYGDLFDSVPGLYPNIFGVARRVKVRFDASLAEGRRELVLELFDQTISSLLPELQAVTKIIHEAEQRLDARPNERASLLLKRARQIAYMPVISEPATSPGQQTTKQGKIASEKALPASDRPWQAAARKNYMRAMDITMEAMTLISR